MEQYWEVVKRLKTKVLNDALYLIEKCKLNQSSLKLAVVAYRDHEDEKIYGSYLTTKIDFTDNMNDFNIFFNSLATKGGFGVNEAAFDGLNEVVNLNWAKDSKKYLFLLLIFESLKP